MTETHLNKRLHQTLVNRQVFDSEAGIQQRNDIISYLEEILREWCQSLLALTSSRALVNQDPLQDAQGISNDDYYNNNQNTITSLPRILSFGSSRLGVQRPGADLDLLALCPSHVSRSDFFLSFLHTLGKISRISDIYPIPTAYTPVIKFRVDGLPIDLLFVQVMWNPILGRFDSSVQDDSFDLLLQRMDDSILIGLDETSVRSINGVRVAQMILGSISNRESFTVTLGAVKEWAAVHGVYSNVLGFLGGINLAIMVAFICKGNPAAKPAVLLKVFFSVFSKWRWPYPVTLCPIVTIPPPKVSPMAVWDPHNNPRDKSHFMPIITPAYPSMNSAYNVGVPQLRRLREEFVRADKIMKTIFSGEKTWDALFEFNDFFRRHIHFLQVDIISSTANDHKVWLGFCKSRLRLLINGLESPECGVHCYPFSKFFHNEAVEMSKSCVVQYSKQNVNDSMPITTQTFVSTFYIALRFTALESIDLKQNTLEFCYIVNSWENRKSGMDLTIKHVTQKNLPTYVHDDSSHVTCTASPMKKARLHNIVLNSSGPKESS